MNKEKIGFYLLLAILSLVIISFSISYILVNPFILVFILGIITFYFASRKKSKKWVTLAILITIYGIAFSWFAPPLSQCAFSYPNQELTKDFFSPVTVGFETIVCSIYVATMPNILIFNPAGIIEPFEFLILLLCAYISIFLFVAIKIDKKAFSMVFFLLLYTAIVAFVFNEVKLTTFVITTATIFTYLIAPIPIFIVIYIITKMVGGKIEEK